MVSDPVKSYQYVKTYRHKVRYSIYAGFGSECCICGYSRCARALQLHHLDPEKKSFTISAWSNHKFSSLLDEAEKCAMLCANCHAEVEDGVASIHKNARRFNKDTAIEVREYCKVIKFEKRYKPGRCLDCKKPILAKSKRCWGCYCVNVKKGKPQK